MRVTSQMMVTGSLRRLQSRLERYEDAQADLATGKRIRKPSDDPASASRSLSLRAAQAANDQAIRAAEDATSLTSRADAELRGATNVLQRVRELAVRANSNTSPGERNAIAEEITQLRDQLVSIANTKHRDRAMFAGQRNVDAISYNGTNWTYDGDQGAIIRRVSDTDRVQVNVTADDIFGFGGPGPNTFDALDQLRADVLADNKAGIGTGLDRVDTAIDNTLEQAASIGAAANRIELSQARTEDTQLTLKTELADVEDTDVAEAIMNLQVEEVAYQSTLQALGRSLPDTLVSFLR